MDRRTALGAILAAPAMAGTAALAAQAKDVGAHGHFERCARVCADCMTHCEINFHHCAGLVAGGKKEHAHPMHLSVDCAELCDVGAKLSARHSVFAVPACEACAKACDLCAAECEKFDDPHMKACAKACRDCARECREMIKNVGHNDKEEKK